MAHRRSDPTPVPGSPGLNRRAMLGGLAVLGLSGLSKVAGCAAYEPPAAAATPRPARPGLVPLRQRPAVVPAMVKAPPSAVRLPVVPRSAWCDKAVGRTNINAMGTIRRITVHHEGANPYHETAWSSVSSHLSRIREGHLRRGWADIGYHYIIDPAGHVIEGRPRVYQGAHVSDNNPGNLGIMLLGNFDRQTPVRRQADALSNLLRATMHRHRVPLQSIYTHQELKPTACPGTRLQAHMQTIRRNRTLA